MYGRGGVRRLQGCLGLDGTARIRFLASGCLGGMTGCSLTARYLKLGQMRWTPCTNVGHKRCRIGPKIAEHVQVSYSNTCNLHVSISRGNSFIKT